MTRLGCRRDPGQAGAAGRLPRPGWHGLAVPAVLGVTGELCAIGLLATGAWLLLSAALRPPILTLSVAIGAVQLFALGRGAARYGERLAGHDLGLRLQAQLRCWLYRRLARLVPGRLPGGDRGDLLTRLICDTDEVQDLVVRVAVPIVSATLAWVSAMLVATALLPRAAAILLAAGLLGAGGVAAGALLSGRRAAALPAARGAVGAWMLQVLTSAEELAVLGATEWAVAELDRRERALGAATRSVAMGTGLGRAAATLAGGTGLAGVAWAGGVAWRAGRIGPTGLGVLVFLALGVAALLRGLPDALSRLPVSRVSLRRLADLGRGGVPVSAAPAGGPAQPPPAGSGSGGGRGRRRAAGITLELEGAAVGYPGPDGTCAPVISGMNLEVAPGRPVALAGPSGCGKSAVVLTLLRFLDLADGAMTVNGADARDVADGRLRALLSWSPEQPGLFPVTLRANLRLAAPHATDGQIRELLADLALGPWLARLDHGLDTVLGPWGQPVSGGERQRLSVARALLADRPVLLLDEPTRHLDAPTANQVLAAVLDRARQRSLLWVSHRADELAMFPQVVQVPAAGGR
ncbi:MAG TPA: thiol reductant ABC exporter subunit CydC [Streptosporangiaceae bacterium]